MGSTGSRVPHTDIGGQPPWRHDRYEYLGLLGSGSFGDVYRARDLVRGHEVALKMLRRWHTAGLTQLRKEFRALRDLEHPNLVTLYELHADDRDGFITMEVVDGITLLDFVRAARDVDERRSRARHCLAQLVEAVAMLHANGTLHRDLKPSNAIVTSSGRLVVLDAGLAKSIDAQRSSERYMCGTPVYMSPEQAFGENLQSASDWYSVGVIAYELYSDRAPFEDHPQGVLGAKVTVAAPSIGEACPDLPLLDVTTIDGLLAREPSKRPDHRALAAWLGAEASPPTDLRRAKTEFVGRHAELERLHEALDTARERGLAVMSVLGNSGIGKTALVQHWLEGLSASEVMPISGRCYQRETVPFGGFEDIFEVVERCLADERQHRILSSEEIASIELVLGRVARTNASEASMSRVAPPELLERRRLFGAAVAHVLQSMSAGRTLVIWLDDLQWAGMETAMLIADIARAKFDRGCLFVLGSRPPAADDGVCVSQLPAYVELTHTLDLAPLLVEDAVALVERSAGAAGIASNDVERLVRDAGGHPLLLEQATRHLPRAGGDGAVDLARILGGRVEELPLEAQELLRVLSVAAEPLPEIVALTAASLTPGSTALRTLLANDLARRVGHIGHRLVLFHDQLRSVVTAPLSSTNVRNINTAIAEALEGNKTTQPELLVNYYLAAGERQRAARYVVAAATHMMQALAFDRAAKLFRLSLDLAGELGREETRSVRLGLADALVNSGRVEEGARIRLEVAAAISGKEADRLVNVAASELIRAGCVDEGLGYARKTFQRLGVRLSASGFAAVPSIALDRARLKLRGLRHEVKPSTAVSPELLERVDWCQSVAIVLPLVDTLRGFQVHNQGLLWALEAGEPSRLGQALAAEAGFRMALAGGRDPDGKVSDLLESARMLAEASGDARARGVVEIIVGSTRWSAADWRGCVDHVEAGVSMLRRHCAGVFWETNFGQTHALDALSWMGALQEKRRVLFDELERARARGDRYAETMYTLRDLPTIHLVDDRVDDARSCSEILARWPNRGFQVEHMADVYKQTEVDLYRGHGVSAARRIGAKWKALTRAQLMRLQPFRIEMHSLHGRAALAAVDELESGAERDRLLKLAGRLSATIEREAPSVRGAVFGAPLAAGIANQEGAPHRACAFLERGIQAAVESGMRLHEHAMRAQLGRLRAGDAGRDSVAAAEAWMQSEGVRRPDVYTRMLCPGLEPQV